MGELLGCTQANVGYMLQELIRDGALLADRDATGAIIARSIWPADVERPSRPPPPRSDGLEKELAPPLAKVAIWHRGQPKGEPWNV
jgi:hypothetical protein